MNYADRVKDTSASVGTGPITLFGAPITGFRSFLSAFPSGAVDVPYAIDDGAGSWEIGIGSFADSVLTRTQVLSSSSNGGLVDFVAGKKSVICTLPADLVESATNRSIAAASESAGHAVQTAQDKAQTGLDRAATAADRLATAADKLQTGIDAEVASSAKSAAESAASSAAESASSAAEQAAAAAPVQSVFGRTGTVTLQSTDVTGALGFTPLDAAQKSAANGIAPLGSDSKVPAAYLPSYVDDVLEYANLAGFPAIGETAKIYVALDTNKTYRWSGSAYVEISPSPGTTDSLTEGATNLYFTTARARAALSATGAVSYNSATGVISAELTSAYGLFVKADPAAVAFTKTAAGAASIKAGTKVDVAGTLVQFAADTAITMPTLTAGTDYAIWLKDNATIQASSSHTSAPGAGNWRKIGGFHYAPGGNAAAQAGGDTTPAINAYSLWDLKFRPACPDPRGMTLVADSFWTDIYLLGVDHLTNGTSKYNVTIADGSSPPKIPTKFGGNGSTAYSTMNWWEANEVLQAYGKRSPSYDEFAALAYGTTEATSGGTDPASTILRNAYTSKWGVMLATGNLWVWGAEFGGGAAAASWVANPGGRGYTFQMENAVLFGGFWDDTVGAGSRASLWNISPRDSLSSIGARGVANHLILD